MVVYPDVSHIPIKLVYWLGNSIIFDGQTTIFQHIFNTFRGAPNAGAPMSQAYAKEQCFNERGFNRNEDGPRAWWTCCAKGCGKMSNSVGDFHPKIDDGHFRHWKPRPWVPWVPVRLCLAACFLGSRGETTMVTWGSLFWRNHHISPVTSLESCWGFGELSQEIALDFRLVNSYNLPRYVVIPNHHDHHHYPMIRSFFLLSESESNEWYLDSHCIPTI